MRASKVTSGIPISWRTGGAAIAFPDDRANRAVNTIRTAKNNNLSFDFIFFSPFDRNKVTFKERTLVLPQTDLTAVKLFIM
jgi:hypothetical protein